jgi:POT family proton-dependent oligopeptide transporter
MSSVIGARHPIGLYLLCVVELCERFAGSLLGSLLLLYLNERIGLSPGSATRLGGAFNAAVYLSSVLGGVVADRWLGTYRAILLGAALLAVGYGVLSVDRVTALYPAAGLLVLGHALFKPNISAAVGKLYDRGSPRREDAFSVFYVVFNIGAACGPVAGGSLRAGYGWSIAFSVAALAMLLALVAGILSYRWLAATVHSQGTATRSAKPLARPAWPLGAMAGILGAGLLFTASYEQSGQSLLFWARDCTQRSLLGHSLPPSSLLALPGLLVLMLQPLLTRTMSSLAKRRYPPTVLSRIQVGLGFGVVAYVIMVGAALLHGQRQAAVSAWWLVACFVALTIGELLVYPLMMALVTRLAPPAGTAAAMGLLMASFAAGQLLAGEVAARWAVWSNTTLFATLAGIALAASVVMRWARKRIRAALSPIAFSATVIEPQAP